jgi:hypothetical protein
MNITESTLLKLAREIAMETAELPDILARMGISNQQWSAIRALPRFQYLLGDLMSAWSSAQNTPERVKLKSAGMLEEALPEMYQRIHDGREPLAAKTELLKLIARLAGIGNERVEGQIAEKFVLSINIGDGTKRELSVANVKTIEHQP